MNKEFNKFIDFTELQKLTDDLYNSTGIPSSIIDMDGKILTGSGWQKICTEFHRKNKEVEKQCIESDTKLRESIKKGNTFAVYKCPMGLVDASSPLIIDGIHIANVFVGQVFLEEKTEQMEKFFREQAKKYGFNESEYIKAYKEVPVFSEEQFGSSLKFLSSLAKFISYAGLAKKKEIEAGKIIKEREKLFRRLVESTSSVQWEMDILTLKFNYISPQAEQMFGYPLSYWRNIDSMLMLISAGQRNAIKKQIENNIKMLKDFELEYESIKENNTKMWIKNSFAVIREDNLPVKLTGFMIDITKEKESSELWKKESVSRQEKLRESENTREILLSLLEDQKETEIALQKSEFKFRTMIDFTYDWEYWEGPRGELIYISPSCETITGYTQQDFFDSDDLILNIVHHEDKHEFIKHRRNYCNSDNLYTTDEIIFHITAKTGEIKTIHHKCRPIHDDEGNYLGNRISNRDITDQKIMENALKESEERFKLAMEASTDGIFDWNMNTDKTYYSPAWKKMLGYEADELKNRFSVWEELTVPEDVMKTKSVLNDYINGKKDRFEAEFRMKHKDGHYVFIHARGNAYFDKDGKPYRMIGTHVDITARKKAEYELLKERDRAQKYLDVAAVMFLVIDKNGIISLVNRKGCEILERNEDEIIGKNWFNIFLPGNVRKDVKIVFQKLMKGEVKNVEYVENFINVSSGRKIIAWHNTILRDENGNIIGTLSSGEDITERKESEKALLQSEEKFRMIISSAGEGIIYVASSGKILEVNPQLLEMLNIGREEIIFHHVVPIAKRFISKKNIGRILEIISRGLSGKDIPRFELDYYEKTLSIKASFIKENRTIVGIISDVTREKKAELELRESEKKYRMLFSQMLAGFALHEMICDDKGNPVDYRFIEVNPAFEKMTGLKKEEITGKTVLEILPGTEKYWIEKYGRVVTTGKPLFYENFSAELDKYFEVVAYKPETGQFATIIQDITERKKVEEELTRHRENLERLVEERTNELNNVNKQLEIEAEKSKLAEISAKKALIKEKELSEMKSNFLSMASHEFRTPLTSIMSTAEYLEIFGKEIPEEKFYSQVKRIEKSADNMTKMLEDVLTLNRAERGKFDPKPEKTDLKVLCMDLLDQHIAQAGERVEIVLHYKCNKNTFLLDERHINHILSNLLSNAVKFSPDGGVVDVIVDYRDGHLKLEVSDMGRGIPAEEQKNIFEPFHRGRDVSNIPGSGLGLTIVKNNVEMLNGSISFKSKPHKGTTFFVTIPV